ncbi:hypothetical protein BH23ACT9_BH23ACT9_05900 [soil metagenome]
MHKRTTATSLLAAAALVSAMTVPAGAIDTEVQFTVTANTAGLSVATAAGPTTVGGAPLFSPTAGTITGTLPTVTVTDARGTLLAGWTLAVVGEAFVSGTNSVAATNARVYNDVADATALTTALGSALDGMTLTGGEFTVGTKSLAASYTLLAGTTPTGNGSVAFTPTIDVTIPALTPVGTYSATVSYTVS